MKLRSSLRKSIEIYGRDLKKKIQENPGRLSEKSGNLGALSRDL